VVFVGMAEITSKCRNVTLDLIVDDVLCIPEFPASHRVPVRTREVLSPVILS